MCKCNCCARGPQGPTGEIGYGFLVSNGAPIDPPTDNRIYYLDLLTGDIYEWDGAVWNLIGTLGGGAPINETYNILAPSFDTDTVNVILTGNALSTNVRGDVTFGADRIGDDGDITVSIVSPDGITFTGGATSFILASTESITAEELEHPVGLPVGAYNFTFEWAGTSVNRTQNVTINLS